MSQNFLVDEQVLKSMVSAANLSQKDCVLEIGAGLGTLTKALLDTGSEVFAIEKDKKLASYLQYLKNEKLHIIIQDCRSIDLQALFNNRRIKVLANLPYHLTGWLLRRLVPCSKQISTIHFMMQKEVAERCTAQVKSKHYSALSLFIQYYSNAQLLCKIPASSFYPKPRVDSAILQLELKDSSFIKFPYIPLFTLIQKAFQKKRKMLRSSLREIAPPHEIERALTSIGAAPTGRPQHLTLQEVAKLIEMLCKNDKIHT